MAYSKEISEEQYKFLDWLCKEDVSDQSDLECILSIDEYEFIRGLLKVGVYDEEERNELMEILDRDKVRINKYYSKYLKENGI